MPLGKTLERAGGLFIILGFLAVFPAIPANYFDLMGPRQALLVFGFGGLCLSLFGFLLGAIGIAFGMDEGGASSIPDEELTPEQQLRKRELELEERRQRQEGTEKTAELFFGSGDGSDGGSAGTKNERDGKSLTDTVRQTKNKYTGKYVRSPKCPDCGSQATAPTGEAEGVFQCDKCGMIFETRARGRRDVNVDVDE